MAAAAAAAVASPPPINTARSPSCWAAPQTVPRAACPRRRSSAWAAGRRRPPSSGRPVRPAGGPPGHQELAACRAACLRLPWRRWRAGRAGELGDHTSGTGNCSLVVQITVGQRVGIEHSGNSERAHASWVPRLIERGSLLGTMRRTCRAERTRRWVQPVCRPHRRPPAHVPRRQPRTPLSSPH